MGIPQNLIKESNVVNNVTSTSVISPLSANMGTFLQQQINSLGPHAGFGFIRQIPLPVTNRVVDLIALPIGTIQFDMSSTLSPYLSLTDTDVDNVAVFNNSVIHQGGGIYTRPDPIGQFSVSAPQQVYFSADGLNDPSLGFNFPTSRTIVNAVIAFTNPGILTSLTFDLIFKEVGATNGVLLIEGQYATYPQIFSTAFRLELNDAGGLVTDANQWSFGNGEADGENGTILPLQFNANRFALDFTSSSGLPAVGPVVAIEANHDRSALLYSDGTAQQAGILADPITLYPEDTLSVKSAQTAAAVEKGTLVLFGDLVL